MTFDFGRIFPEVNTYFNLTSEFLQLLSDQLNSLNKEIKHFNKVFDGGDYSLVFIISATRKNDALEVKGPTVLKKRKEVEFALHIPFKELRSSYEETLYVLQNIYQGIICILTKYKVDLFGVEEKINDVIKIVEASPDMFLEKKPDW